MAKREGPDLQREQAEDVEDHVDNDVEDSAAAVPKRRRMIVAPWLMAIWGAPAQSLSPPQDAQPECKILRKAQFLWLSFTWEEKMKAEAQEGCEGPDRPDGTGGPNGSDGPNDAVVTDAERDWHLDVKIIQHTREMIPQWELMTTEEKMPWITQSRELQTSWMSTCALLQAKHDSGENMDLLEQVAECSSFGGRGMRVGNFQVRDQAPSLAAGTFGTVLQAIHVVTGQRGALKVFGNSPGALDSMKREMEIYQMVQTVSSESSGVFLQLLGSSETPMPWICLEDGAGASVRDLMVKNVWNVDWLYPVASQLRLALLHMHSAGLAHLDVTTAKLVLDTTRMRLRIVDVGTAERWKGDNMPSLSRETYVTEAYRPPELFYIDCNNDNINRFLLPYADWRPC
jgi:hypothetical protein